ncbi:unnamed protein product, partial [Rangifer tarandus platyrhynchus]
FIQGTEKTLWIFSHLPHKKVPMIVLRDSKEEHATFWKTPKANLLKGTVDSVYTVLFFFFILVSHEKGLVVQSCPSLHNTMDCSPPGSSVPGISQ